MATRKLFNAASQTVEEAELSVDKNNEIVATFADGTFVKFAAGLDKEGFEAAIVAHQAANEGQEVITPEMEAEQAALRANSFALIGEDEPKEADTTASEQSNAEPTDQPDA